MKDVLKHISDNNLLPPLMVIDVLARSSSVQLGSVKVGRKQLCFCFQAAGFLLSSSWGCFSVAFALRTDLTGAGLD